MPRKRTIEDCQDKAREHGGKCISHKYINRRTKIEWECSFGHRWFARPGDIFYQGSWCPECYNNRRGNNRRKFSKDVAVSIAKKHGERCLSKSFTSTADKVRWECKRGHIFETIAKDVLYKGTWCKYCYYEDNAENMRNFNRIRQKSIIANLPKIAIAKSGSLLSLPEEYENAHTKLKWKCGHGHEFLSSYLQVGIMGQWCPRCRAKTQNKIYNILKEIFPEHNIRQNYRGFGWLKDKKRLEIDIFVDEVKLAVEYDGLQHFQPVNFGGMTDEKAKQAFVRQKNLDKIKNTKIAEHPEDIRYFVRISCHDKDKIDTSFVIEKLETAGVKI